MDGEPLAAVDVAQCDGHDPRLRRRSRRAPKNWWPSAGEVLGAGGGSANTASGPNVASRAFGPKAPALSGPATNSQNGSNAPIAARDGSYRCAAG